MKGEEKAMLLVLLLLLGLGMQGGIIAPHQNYRGDDDGVVAMSMSDGVDDAVFGM